MIKVGFGFDVHRLEEGNELWIGGVKIDSDKGSVGHSDGDVLIHAICDAILGSANLRDIGFHFPDTDQKYKGIESKILLRQVCVKLDRAGYVINNIDSTVSLEKPKISGYVPDMINVLSESTGLSKSNISVKATTTEKLGFTGRQEGIAAYAVVLIRSK